MKRLAAAFACALALTGAHAGAWSDGSFDNDDAMDWVNDCVHATSPGVVKAAFDRVLNAEVVEAPDASAAIAAAVVAAASLGKPNPAKQFPDVAQCVAHQGVDVAGRIRDDVGHYEPHRC